MIRHSIGVAFLLLFSILCSQAHATHIQYVDDWNESIVSFQSGEEYVYTFNLITDDMDLYEIATHYDGGPAPDEDYIGIGSYDPADTLHYVYLRIEPNDTGPHEGDLSVSINGSLIGDWQNPICLYDWGVPDDPLDDPYSIATTNYEIIVTLTANEAISVKNVNLEGCFDTGTPVPEPATMLLLGSGLLGLVGFRRKMKI